MNNSAVLKFHSLRGKKLALAHIKASAFDISVTAVFVSRDGFPSDVKKGDTVTIPSGFRIVPLVNFETGEVVHSESGEELKTLTYA